MPCTVEHIDALLKLMEEIDIDNKSVSDDDPLSQRPLHQHLPATSACLRMLCHLLYRDSYSVQFHAMTGSAGGRSAAMELESFTDKSQMRMFSSEFCWSHGNASEQVAPGYR